MSPSVEPSGRRPRSRPGRSERGRRTGETLLLVAGITVVLVVGGLIVAGLDGASRDPGGTVFIGVGMLVVVAALVGVLLHRSRAAAGDVTAGGSDPSVETRLRHRLTPEELADARRRHEQGFDWEDICRLVVPGYAWWSPAEKVVFRNHLEGEVSRPT